MRPVGAGVGLLALNLWSPHHGLSVGLVVVTSFLLGVVHGVTPDEHTWPITFSYALGSFSARKGMRAALAFSLSFTLQRALLSELAYLGLLHVADNPTWNAAIYLVVGAVMALAAFYVLRLRCALHLHLWPPSVGGCHRPQHAETAEWASRTPTPAMAAVHGFVAGWGLGAFALIMATVLAPAMPSAAFGWVPGAAFGLGTTAVLVVFGAVIGSLIRHQRLPEQLAQRVAQEGAGWTLLVGGVLFVAAGAAGLMVPSIMTAGISTGIHVHNLDQLGIGTLLVAVVVVVAVVTVVRTVHRMRHLPPEEGSRVQTAGSGPAADGFADRRSRPSRVVVLARPGAGKSTQAAAVAAALGVVHLSLGELLRHEVAAASTLGRAVAGAVDRGDLVADEVALEVLVPLLERAVLDGGYVLDDFPRDLAQAEALDRLAARRLAPDVALSLEVSATESRGRLEARAQIEHRSDDIASTVERRFVAYDDEMAPVLEYYRRARLLVSVDGEGAPSAVTARVLEVLSAVGAPSPGPTRP